MNSIKYIALFALTICVFVACKKESLLTYNISDNIYFNYKPSSGGLSDSADVSFATRIAAVQDSVFKLPIAVTGVAKDKDRTYKVIVVDSNTTAVAGKHFILPSNFIIRAGRILDTLSIRLLRTADLQSKAIKLKLALQENDTFRTGIKLLNANAGGNGSALTFRLNISDMLIEAPGWASAFAPYFGTFSAKKLRLINEVTGMRLDYQTTYVFDAQSAAKRVVYAITMSRYLSDQKAAGNTIYEVDGTEMKMNATYQ